WNETISHAVSHQIRSLHKLNPRSFRVPFATLDLSYFNHRGTLILQRSKLFSASLPEDFPKKNLDTMIRHLLANLKPSEKPNCLLHCDLQTTNILFDDKGQAGFVDLED